MYVCDRLVFPLLLPVHFIVFLYMIHSWSSLKKGPARNFMLYPVSGILVVILPALWTIKHSKKNWTPERGHTVLRKPLNMRYNK